MIFRKTVSMREAREMTGLSCREFCKEIGVPWSTYRLIESGEREGRESLRKQIRDYFAKKLDIEVVFPRPVCTDFSLKGLRKSNGWTQAEVAEKIGASLASYGSWERGDYNPNLIYYLKLLDLYKYELGMNIEGGYRITSLAWRPTEGVPGEDKFADEPVLWD